MRERVCTAAQVKVCQNDIQAKAPTFSHGVGDRGIQWQNVPTDLIREYEITAKISIWLPKDHRSGCQVTWPKNPEVVGGQ